LSFIVIVTANEVDDMDAATARYFRMIGAMMLLTGFIFEKISLPFTGDSLFRGAFIVVVFKLLLEFVIAISAIIAPIFLLWTMVTDSRAGGLPGILGVAAVVITYLWVVEPTQPTFWGLGIFAAAWLAGLISHGEAAIT
jgi:hypothetical protein